MTKPGEDRVREVLNVLIDKAKSDELYKADLNNIISKTINKNLANARKRDKDLRNNGGNFRADFLMIVSLMIMTGSVVGLVFFSEIFENNGIMLLSTLIGFSISILRDFVGFEFGRSDLEAEMNAVREKMMSDCMDELKIESKEDRCEMFALCEQFKHDAEFRFRTNQIFANSIEQNIQDARLRDAYLRSKKLRNWRADLITYFGVVILCATISLLFIYRSMMRTEIIMTLTTIIGFWLYVGQQVAAYEFGGMKFRSYKQC
jgi:hypothetical protein